MSIAGRKPRSVKEAGDSQAASVQKTVMAKLTLPEEGKHIRLLSV